MPLLKDYEKIKAFINRVFKLASDLKIPILDEKTLKDVKIFSGNLCWEIKFKAKEGSVDQINAFLALAQYFKSVIIKKGDAFYIPHGCESYKLESE
ncbi:MAG: hypothetical protein ACTSSJ_06855 [Candidatus Odinarchaeia archaeon]